MTTEFDPVQWLEGLPRESSITDGEVRRMWELGAGLRRNAIVVELGVWQGRSACLLAKIAQQRDGFFYAIDHFEHPGCSRQKVLDRLEARGLDRISVVLEQSTGNVLWGDLKIDFLHIDADHTSPGIDADCAKFLPLVQPGGVVAFDDYAQLSTEAHYPDVKRMADRECPESLWEDLGVTDGMKFFRRRP
jgi:predicted O-methyltransferase YrrM